MVHCREMEVDRLERRMGVGVQVWVWGLVGSLSLLMMVGLASGQSELIEVVNRRDHVYDASREVLYISTSDGDLERYHLPSSTMLAPLEVGQELNGFDIVPDGSALYVTEGVPGNASAVIYKVDLASGVVSPIRYVLDSQQESGGWDLVIASNGLGFLTSQRAGAGHVPVRQLNLNDDTIEIRRDIPRAGGTVSPDTHLTRNGNRDTLLFSLARTTSGPIFRYDAATDSFGDVVETGLGLSSSIASMSRDGDFTAEEMDGDISIRNRDLQEVASLANFDGGLVFSPVADVLFVGDIIFDEIVAFDTVSWEELYRIEAGGVLEESRVFGAGLMSMTDDGKTLFVSVAEGIRRIELVRPMDLKITPFPLRSGEPGVIEMEFGRANVWTFFVYGVRSGTRYVPMLNVELDIGDPRLFGRPVRSDADGKIRWEFTVPRLRFKEMHGLVQAAQVELKSNVFRARIVR